MAAPIRRPQFLLPWIAGCTLVLGATLRLALPEDSRSSGGSAEVGPGLAGAPSGAADRMTPGIPDPAAGAAEMAAGDAARDADPLLPGIQPALDQSQAESLAEPHDRLTTLGSHDLVPPVLAPSSGPPVDRPEHRPALLTESFSPASAEFAAIFDAPPPPVGSGFALGWDGSWLDPEDEDEAADPALRLRPTFYLLRLADDDFRIVLTLDDGSEDPLEDPARDGGKGDAGGESSKGEDPGSEPAAESTPRQVWARWFSANVPTPYRPANRQHAAALLARLVGQERAQTVISQSRRLSPREAAQNFGYLRRWVQTHRPGR